MILQPRLPPLKPSKRVAYPPIRAVYGFGWLTMRTPNYKIVVFVPARHEVHSRHLITKASGESSHVYSEQENDVRTTFRLGEHHDTRRRYTDLIDGFIVEHGGLLRKRGRKVFVVPPRLSGGKGERRHVGGW